MQRASRFLTGVSAAIILAALSLVGASRAAPNLRDPENTLVITLEAGKVYLALRPDLAPRHVARVKTLVRQGFYDGIVFHRVIAGFMAQTGDPSGTGKGGSGQNIRAEFNGEPFVRGSVGMARAQDPHSADSQFFICFDDADWLNGKYTNFGRVIFGMEHIDGLRKGAPGSGIVRNPDRMISVRVAADP